MSYTHVEKASAKPPRIFWPLLGLGIVLAADGATALIFHALGLGANSNLSILYLAAPVAALLVGIPAGFHFIVVPNCTTIRRGLLTGIVSSIIAHPVMWMFLWILALFTPQAIITLSLPNLLLEILFSLIYGGWATTPIGALAGLLFIVLQRALMRTQQQRVDREAEAIQWREMSSADASQTGSGVEDVRS